MIVSRLDKNHDWTFGQSLANYARSSEAIAQNVLTRVLSWKNDWFLDIEAEIDWYTLLSERNTRRTIEDELYRVTRNTTGVFEVISITSNVKRSTRSATFTIEYTDIYNQTRVITNET